MLASYQFLIHILMWWTLWSFRDSSNLNFLTYLYLLTEPVLLFLGTSLLAPDTKLENLVIRDHLANVRTTYATVLILLLFSFLAVAIALRSTTQ